jgi:hypothetical protein
MVIIKGITFGKISNDLSIRSNNFVFISYCENVLHISPSSGHLQVSITATEKYPARVRQNLPWRKTIKLRGKLLPVLLAGIVIKYISDLILMRES